MRPRFSRTLFVATAILTLFANAVFSAPQSGQKQASGPAANVIDLTRFAFLRDFFNLAQGTVRIVAVVSPTCPLCRRGVAEIQHSLEAIPSNRFRAFVVFSPELEGDTREDAVNVAGEFIDRRLAYFWDEEKHAGEAFKEIAGSDTPVWDVYFLYDTNAVINTTPEPPAIWMHQHDRLDAPKLDGEKLQGTVLEMLERLEQRRREEKAPQAPTKE